MRFAAIIVAAGRGTRAGGGLPKQYRALAGRPVLAHTLAAFAGHPGLGALIVVHHPDDHAALGAIAPGFAGLVAVPGGAERAASVRAGLAAVPEDCAAVLIHDAARPLVSRRVIDGVLAALATHPAAAPAVAVTDALWRGAGGHVAATVPREGLYRAQTPQGFHTAAIRAAHEGHGANAADDVEVARAAGLDVAIVEGDETNLKITRAEDFARAEQLMRTRAMKDIRTGTGFDVHAFCPGDGVVLCGVRVPHTRALSGHSDADVGMHALTDAIYGALAEGDIGQHFPPSDMRWKGAASHIFLEHAVVRVAARGFVLSNADITLICEYPKIGPHAGAMRAALAGLLGVEQERVSVKATTSERLGFTGREEGIAALASVTLIAP